MKVVWTPMGLESLNETIKFIREQWNEEVTDLFLERLDNRIEQLRKNPKMGSIYNRTPFRRLLIHPLITLYYSIEIDFVSLLLVWANKQNPDELKRRLQQM